jgi:DNA-binding MarR family transcriptional regulator
VVDGHLARRPSTTDRRQAILELTADGRRLLDRVTQNRRRTLAEVTASWEADELSLLLTLLIRLRDNLESIERCHAR